MREQVRRFVKLPERDRKAAHPLRGENQLFALVPATFGEKWRETERACFHTKEKENEERRAEKGADEHFITANAKKYKHAGFQAIRTDNYIFTYIYCLQF
jgi:hemerythrin-like domain-containing protein